MLDLSELIGTIKLLTILNTVTSQGFIGKIIMAAHMAAEGKCDSISEPDSPVVVLPSGFTMKLPSF